MELTDRDRQILAELERQFSTDEPAATARLPGAPTPRRSARPRWAVRLAAVLGVALLAAGIFLGVADSVLLGLLLVLWCLSPSMRKVRRAAGQLVLESFQNAPPGGMR